MSGGNPAPHEPPICRCDECDRVMDFDDLADSYFAFLGSQKAMFEPDRVAGAIQPHGEMVGQLRGAGAPRAGIYQGTGVGGAAHGWAPG